MGKLEQLIQKARMGKLSNEEKRQLEFMLAELRHKQHAGEKLTKKELLIINTWNKHISKHSDKIPAFIQSDRDLHTKATHSWRKAAKQLSIDTDLDQTGTTVPMVPERKVSRKHHIAAWASVAAAIAILIFISFPLLKNNGANEDTTSSELLAQTEIAQQFITEGKMKKITLADGSVVHLNMETTLSLHKNKFNAYTREVWLDEGEAFFEITKDPNRPFVVHTADGLSTQVLGTSFNIKAYHQLEEQVVSVKTGRVQVSKKNGDKVLLDPNNKASFNSLNGTLTAGITDGTAAADWRTGNIVLQETGIKEIALRLKQYYGVELINKAGITQQVRVHFAFTTDTRIDDVARSLADIYKTRYKINDNKLILIK